MVAFTTDEVMLTVKIGLGVTITMPHDALICVIERETDKVDVGDGIRFSYNGYYCFYHRDKFVKLTENEWRQVVWHASDISPPPVNMDLCTLCERYVVGDVHKGCDKRRLKMDLFVATPFGKELIRIFTDLVRKKEHGDNEALKRAMAGLQRNDVVAAFGLDHNTLYRYGPAQNINENILKFDRHFRNFKALVGNIVKKRIKKEDKKDAYLRDCYEAYL